jgi:predicted PurR-regulated permease PerM
MAETSSRDQRALNKWLVPAFVGASLLFAAPYAGVVIASIWAAQLARPIMDRTARALGGRRRAGAAVTVLIVLILLVPVSIVAWVAAATAKSLFAQLHHSTAVIDSVRDSAMSGLQTASRGASQFLISFALFVLGAYTCLVDGGRAWRWARRTMPIEESTLDRLAGAFAECGRGLIVGLVLTAFTQGLVATIVYSVIGVPHALAFGALTFLAAFVPLVGTSVVWVPLSISLFVSGRTLAAVALVCAGVLLIGTVDNMVRPYFSRTATLPLPTWVLALAMFGGLALLGFQGLILGPVVVRLTSELLEIRSARS